MCYAELYCSGVKNDILPGAVFFCLTNFHQEAWIIRRGFFVGVLFELTVNALPLGSIIVRCRGGKSVNI